MFTAHNFLSLVLDAIDRICSEAMCFGIELLSVKRSELKNLTCIPEKVSTEIFNI